MNHPPECQCRWPKQQKDDGPNSCLTGAASWRFVVRRFMLHSYLWVRCCLSIIQQVVVMHKLAS